MEAIQLLDAKTVAKMLKCSLPLIYKMADRGQLPCVRWDCPGIGTEKPRTTVRFRLPDILKFVNDHYHGQN